ncbi:MAG: hypothetical protein JWP35_1309 [Caulobacter sp.]|nr:hypothetical protein [Caulobacter sp.]
MAESQLTDGIETSGGRLDLGLLARQTGQVLWRRWPVLLIVAPMIAWLPHLIIPQLKPIGLTQPERLVFSVGEGLVHTALFGLMAGFVSLVAMGARRGVGFSPGADPRRLASAAGGLFVVALVAQGPGILANLFLALQAPNLRDADSATFHRLVLWLEVSAGGRLLWNLVFDAVLVMAYAVVVNEGRSGLGALRRAVAIGRGARWKLVVAMVVLEGVAFGKDGAWLVWRRSISAGHEPSSYLTQAFGFAGALIPCLWLTVVALAYLMLKGEDRPADVSAVFD